VPPTTTAGPALADLRLDKQGSPNPVRVGDVLTYTLKVENHGPGTATHVTLVDTIPDDVTFLSLATTQGTCQRSGQLAICSIGTLASGADATVTLQVRPRDDGLLVNVAAVAALQHDPHHANNLEIEVVRVRKP
jgi:uncharacterized repeat protein (TIGR01451 family)